MAVDALPGAHHVEAGVVEGGDGVVEGHPDGASAAEFGDEPGQQEEEGRELGGNGVDHHAAEQAGSAGDLRAGAGQFHAEELASAHAEAAAGDQDQDAGVHGDAEAAELHQHERDGFAEPGECVGGVKAGESGDADGGDGGEESVEEADLDAVLGGDAEAEQRAAAGHDGGEGDDDHPGAGYDAPAAALSDADDFGFEPRTAQHDVAGAASVDGAGLLHSTSWPHFTPALSTSGIESAPRGGRRSTLWVRGPIV